MYRDDLSRFPFSASSAIALLFEQSSICEHFKDNFLGMRESTRTRSHPSKRHAVSTVEGKVVQYVRHPPVENSITYCGFSDTSPVYLDP